ncbi:hypothetical protein KOR34_18760 [Posidoniimonas corsicana]|uniref:Uncharacterized protein n=1 Tax=Posidoniimonas corsicana TaxID=1938618 RepID=A0A5C5VFP8_9BACT|nr:tetratricopeptide repeat protein [Posidoniimonas corsicana]TWT36931.1 hypothetical protein KOR34_18760 [Posidoniimonas corsicana]
MLRSRTSAGRPLALIACLVLAAAAAPAATGSELLEKAIYTEETVGDLDQAIEIYQKVVAEGAKSIDAAAEAQFRIGACLEKQGKTQEATKAFQAVVDDYPKATRWVAKAKDRLPGSPKLLATPWGDGDELQFEMKLPTGMGIGCQIYRVAKQPRDGVEAWKCESWQVVTLNGAFGKSRVWADLDTFAPIESHWRHSVLGEADAVYEKDKVVITLAGRSEPVTLESEGPLYDNEQAAEMFRRLPLKEGFKTTPTVISSLTAMAIPLKLSVTKVETIEVPAGKFECFRLHIDDLNQTFWIANDERRNIVRFAAGGVVADLMEVRKATTGESVPLKRDLFTLTLPPEWHTYTPSQSEQDPRTTTWLIDPDATMQSRVEGGELTPIKEKFTTPSDWLKEALKKYRERLVDLTLDDDSIQAVEINGRQAAVAVFEYKEGDKNQKAQRVAVFGDKSAVNLRFSAPTEDFDKWQPAITKIVSSLKVE